MKEIILFGAKEFEKRLKYYIETYSENRVRAFCVDKEYMDQDEFCGVPVISTDNITELFPPHSFELLVGIGYRDMNGLRRKKFEEFKSKGYFLYNFIHPSAQIDPSAELGEGNIILSNAVIDYRTRVGNSNIIESGTIISHECDVNSFNYFAPGVVCGGKVHVGNNCFFGLNAVLRSAIKISDHTLIGAGCYLDENSDEYGVYVPERKVKLKKKSTEMNIIYRED